MGPDSGARPYADTRSTSPGKVMRRLTDSNELRGSLEDDSYRELRLLEEVESTPQVSQRHLARRLGIALGMANLLVRSLAKKGYIRASRVQWKTWAYVLTPAGIARKVHLTLAYIERFVDHYRRVRMLLRDELSSLAIDSDARIAIYGTTEIAEMVYLALREMGVTRIDFFDQDQSDGTFLGMPVQGLDSLVSNDYSMVMVAQTTQIEARFRELHARGVASSQIAALLQSSGSQPVSGPPAKVSQDGADAE